MPGEGREHLPCARVGGTQRPLLHKCGPVPSHSNLLGLASIAFSSPGNLLTLEGIRQLG